MTAPQPAERTLPTRQANLGGSPVGSDHGLFAFAGPCVLESQAAALDIAKRIAEVGEKHGVRMIFKASFDKANRTSAGAFRGPGVAEGLAILAEVREATGLSIVTDVHLPEQCAEVGKVVDVLQIPAFLCRQTDLLLAAAETGRTVNIKKGQFLAPWDMEHPVNKVRAAGNPDVMVCERGASFGYGRLVVDMSGFEDMAGFGAPVVFDATHSVQRPGEGGKTGGDRQLAPALARAAVATGHVDGLFFEVHPDPTNSPSDAANIIALDNFDEVLGGVAAIHRAVRAGHVNV